MRKRRPWTGWGAALILTAGLAGASAAEPGADWRQATNLPDWEPRAKHAGVVFKDKLWILGGYCGAGAKNDVWSSEDGVAWKHVQPVSGAAIWGPRSGHGAVVFDDKIWVLGGTDGRGRDNEVWCTQDGTVWRCIEPAGKIWEPRDRHAVCALNGKLWVIGGYDGERLLSDIWCSEDGASWREVNPQAAWSPRQYHGCVVFGNRIWVLGGDEKHGRCNDVWCSFDGVVWTEMTKRASWSPRYLHGAAAFDNKLWVLGGHGLRTQDDKNDVWCSESGIKWTQVDTYASEKMWSPRSMHCTLAFNDNLWVIAGDGYAGGRTNDVWKSADGAAWEQATRAAGWSVRDRHAAIAHGDALWVLGGFGGNRLENDVWRSPEGAEWEHVDTGPSPRMWSPRYSHAAVSYSDRIWVMGGCDEHGLLDDVWCSEDGELWDQMECPPRGRWFSARHHHAAVVFLGKMWIIGGRDKLGLKSDVWTSYDGRRWRRLTEFADWSAREYHAAVALGSRLYVIGGNAAKGRLNDVWYTQEGVNWSQVDTSESEKMWTPRTSHRVLAEDWALWLMGGYDERGLQGDVWTSSDGAQWRCVKRPTPWSAREDHAAAVHRGRIYVIGGFSENLMNDVWYSQIRALPSKEGVQDGEDEAQSQADEAGSGDGEAEASAEQDGTDQDA